MATTLPPIEGGVVIGPLNAEKWRGQRCVVIGGAGFLGKHLVEQLCFRGARVVVFDIVPYRGTMQNVESITADMQNRQALDGALKGAYVVFLVASPSPFLRDENIFYNVNVKGTECVIESCRSVGVERLVLTSSCSVLWNGNDVKNADESTPYADPPIDGYTKTKILQEKLVLKANDSSKLRTVAIRPHSIFGPGDLLVLNFVERGQKGALKVTIGDGTNLSDFTFVGNVVAAHLLAAERLAPSSTVCGKAYNITNDEPVPFWGFAGLVLERIGQPKPSIHLPYYAILVVSIIVQFLFEALAPIVTLKTTFTPQVVRLAGTHHYYDCTRAKNELGYKPFVSLSDGITRSVDYILQMQKAKSKK